MLPDQNVEIVRRSLEAFDHGDIERALAAADPGLVTTRVDPDGAVFHGPEGFLQALSEWVEDFTEWSNASEELIDAGDRVVARVHQVARGAGSGVPVEADYWLIFTLADGNVTRLDIYSDRGQALAAAGLRQ